MSVTNVKYRILDSSIALLFALLAINGTMYAKSAFSCHSEKAVMHQSIAYEEYFCNVARTFVEKSTPIGIISVVSSNSKSPAFTTYVSKGIKYRRGIKKEENFLTLLQVGKSNREIDSCLKRANGSVKPNSPFNIAQSIQLLC